MDCARRGRAPDGSAAPPEDSPGPGCPVHQLHVVEPGHKVVQQALDPRWAGRLEPVADLREHGHGQLGVKLGQLSGEVKL